MAAKAAVRSNFGRQTKNAGETKLEVRARHRARTKPPDGNSERRLGTEPYKTGGGSAVGFVLRATIGAVGTGKGDITDIGEPQRKQSVMSLHYENLEKEAEM